MAFILPSIPPNPSPFWFLQTAPAPSTHSVRLCGSGGSFALRHPFLLRSILQSQHALDFLLQILRSRGRWSALGATASAVLRPDRRGSWTPGTKLDARDSPGGRAGPSPGCDPPLPGTVGGASGCSRPCQPEPAPAPGRHGEGPRPPAGRAHPRRTIAASRGPGRPAHARTHACAAQLPRRHS